METLKKVVLIGAVVFMGLTILIAPWVICFVLDNAKATTASLAQLPTKTDFATQLAALPSKTDVAAVTTQVTSVGTKVDGVSGQVAGLTKPIGDIAILAGTAATQATLANAKADEIRNGLVELGKKTDGAVKTLDAVKSRVDHNGQLLWGLKTSEARVAEAVKNLNVAEFDMK